MKGFSSVIVVILLLLITISITGFAFMFFARVAQAPASGIEQQLTQQTQQFGSTFNIEGVSGNQVYIRNTGPVPLTNLAFAVNGVSVNYTSGPASLAPDQVGTYTLNDNQLIAIPERSTVRITSPGWSSEISASPTPLIIVDVAPPVISGIQASSITQTSALIAWTTNEQSTSTVSYRESSQGIYSRADGVDGTLHSVQLSGLSSSTRYFFVVISADSYGNTNQSSEHSFMTSNNDNPPGGKHKYYDNP